MKYIGIYSVLFFLIACVKPPETPQPKPMPVSEWGAYVLNEGNFQWGNASVDYIDFNTNQISSDVFKTQNGKGIGDVLQSASVIDDKIWFVINNSRSIEIVDKRTCQSIQKITDLQSPRYALAIGGDRVLVSDLYANGLHVISQSAFTKLDFIPLPGWSEKMLLDTDGIWVTNVKRSFVYLLHPTTLAMMDSIEAGYGNQDIVKDSTGNIWVLASGDENANIPGKITCYHAKTKNIIRQLTFSKSGGKNLRLSPDGKEIYYLFEGGVWKITSDKTALSPTPYIASTEGSLFYGLNIHPVSGHIFITDAKDYVSKGRILEYSPDGQFIREYSAGIIPNSLVFIQPD